VPYQDYRGQQQVIYQAWRAYNLLALQVWHQALLKPQWQMLFRYDPDKYKRQMATGGLADTAPAQRMMQGSQLGSYSDGGQLLSGPGNGMSDDIPASIGGKQPARLADGEFVIPADVVSGIGNGSTGAGADELYKLLDRVRLARTGSDKQGREISPMKYLPT
jgi:hypothetical protein